MIIKSPVVLILMGPMGCGKTTIGELLSKQLGWPFLDGDDYHPPENVAKMRDGIALNDDDRRPWLEILHERIMDFVRTGQSAIMACSALKKSYREILGVDQENVVTVYLKGTLDLLRQRVNSRHHPYMNKDLLISQLDTLEEPQGGIIVDISKSPRDIVEAIAAHLDK